MDSDRLLRLLLAQRGMLLGYILSMVRDIHLAEDVFQDASRARPRTSSRNTSSAGVAICSRRLKSSSSTPRRC
ncbi:MAG: hypothetical protein L0Y71_14540, partial [Gemmataceae bacterium]|nr:hypothetical protein [Gemmataceae bacterium]